MVWIWICIKQIKLRLASEKEFWVYFSPVPELEFPTLGNPKGGDEPFKAKTFHKLHENKENWAEGVHSYLLPNSANA